MIEIYIYMCVKQNWNKKNGIFMLFFRMYIVFFLLSSISLRLLHLIKRPTRDACLCMGDLQAPPAPAAPQAPHFVFLITL